MLPHAPLMLHLPTSHRKLRLHFICTISLPSILTLLHTFQYLHARTLKVLGANAIVLFPLEGFCRRSRRLQAFFCVISRSIIEYPFTCLLLVIIFRPGVAFATRKHRFRNKLDMVDEVGSAFPRDVISVEMPVFACPTEPQTRPYAAVPSLKMDTLSILSELKSQLQRPWLPDQFQGPFLLCNVLIPAHLPQPAYLHEM